MQERQANISCCLKWAVVVDLGEGNCQNAAGALWGKGQEEEWQGHGLYRFHGDRTDFRIYLDYGVGITGWWRTWFRRPSASSG